MGGNERQRFAVCLKEIIGFGIPAESSNVGGGFQKTRKMQEERLGGGLVFKWFLPVPPHFLTIKNFHKMNELTVDEVLAITAKGAPKKISEKQDGGKIETVYELADETRLMSIFDNSNDEIKVFSIDTK